MVDRLRQHLSSIFKSRSGCHEITDLPTYGTNPGEKAETCEGGGNEDPGLRSIEERDILSPKLAVGSQLVDWVELARWR